MSSKFRIVEHLERNCNTVTGLTQCTPNLDNNCMTLSYGESVNLQALKEASKEPLKSRDGLSTATSGVTATLNNLKCVCPLGKTPNVKTLRQSKGKLDQAVGALECI